MLAQEAVIGYVDPVINSFGYVEAKLAVKTLLAQEDVIGTFDPVINAETGGTHEALTAQLDVPFTDPVKEVADKAPLLGINVNAVFPSKKRLSNPGRLLFVKTGYIVLPTVELLIYVLVEKAALFAQLLVMIYVEPVFKIDGVVEANEAVVLIDVQLEEIEVEAVALAAAQLEETEKEEVPVNEPVANTLPLASEKSCFIPEPLFQIFLISS